VAPGRLGLSVRSRVLLRVAQVFGFLRLRPLARAVASTGLLGQRCRAEMPEADTFPGYHPNGDMMVQCRHSPPHCYDYAGHSRSCT
jgi:hypothetical protein